MIYLHIVPKNKKISNLCLSNYQMVEKGVNCVVAGDMKNMCDVDDTTVLGYGSGVLDVGQFPQEKEEGEDLRAGN